MSNPEFLRNLWLSFTPHKLLAMPILLALSALAIALGSQPEHAARNIYMSAQIAFIGIIWLWGTRNAQASIVDELRDKTWDQQRMSALSPWAMTWGKLFGATAFNWYGGGFCVLLMLVAGIAQHTSNVLSEIIGVCAVGVLLHSATLALNLHAAQRDTRNAPRAGLGWFAGLSLLLLAANLRNQTDGTLFWWHYEFSRTPFWVSSALVFAAASSFAAYRIMCSALQVRTLPWAWPLFALLLAGFLAGFPDLAQGYTNFLYAAFSVSMALTYSSLFSETNSILQWRKLRALAAQRNTRAWLENTPVWTTTLVLTFLCALLLSGSSLSTPNGHLDSLWLLAAACMLLRDACILLFFSFSPTPKRAFSVTLLYLVVIDLLLPFLSKLSGLDFVSFCLFPLSDFGAGSGSLLIMLVQAGIAVALVNWRLRHAAKS